jgi:four helix bundle protein
LVTDDKGIERALFFLLTFDDKGIERAPFSCSPSTTRKNPMQRFTDLKVWQRSHALVLSLYPLAATFPASERFGLSSQLKRAVTSVPANIAEGSKRQSKADFARFLNIAEGSLAETEYFVLLARDLDYLPAEATKSLLTEIDEIARMLHALRTKVEQTDR